MKKLIYLFLALFTLCIGFQACDDTKTYAEMLDEEDDAIAAFIRDSSITVISQSRFYAQDSVTDVSKNEFKMELVRLALEEEGSIAALARKHDVNDNLLFKWIRLWQREGRVCRPRKNSSSLPALIPVQLQAGSSLPTFELPSCSPPATCHIKCRGGEITLTHPSAELMSTVLRELMRGPV